LETNQGNPFGYLALLLHAHLPFVRNTAYEFCVEEKWLFEALTESYIPLLINWERLAKEKIPFQLTLSLSPTLLSMLTANNLVERYGRYLSLQYDLANREIERTAEDPRFKEIAIFYHDRISLIKKTFYDKYHGDIITPLKRLALQEHLELITTCATHGYLPLMLTEESRRAQIRVGIELFRDIFGWSPQGFWLPECGYVPGLEKILYGEGIQYFIIAGHGFLNSVSPSTYSTNIPATINGVTVFGINDAALKQVWDSKTGFPADCDYREFYRDIGNDLEYEYIAPYLVAGLRGDTGFKYYRVTSKAAYKEVYQPDRAQTKIKQHACLFVAERYRQLRQWMKNTPVKPIITVPYDAELFGHWWFEGPDWIAEVLHLTAASESTIQTATFSKYLAKYPAYQKINLTLSSWGEGGYSRYWLNPKNDWIYPHFHQAEKVMQQLSETINQPNSLQERALNQAGRELVLAQSSDWPFILTNGSVPDYARRRIQMHLEKFFLLSQELKTRKIEAVRI
jgi:1,4-alpha-glucan branching enzyme